MNEQAHCPTSKMKLATICAFVMAVSSAFPSKETFHNITATAARGAAPPANISQPDYAFRLCGNYCGPGWCDAKFIKEGECDDSVAPAASCADKCCRDHDKCCGHDNDQSGCNKRIVDCLNHCDRNDHSCKNAAGLGIAAGGLN